MVTGTSTRTFGKRSDDAAGTPPSAEAGMGPPRFALDGETICWARCSAALVAASNASSTRRRWCSMPSVSRSGGTIRGSPRTPTIVLKGRGTANRSQLRARQAWVNPTPSGTMGRPARDASSTIPLFTCRRGPRGPSGVMAQCDFRSSRSSSSKACAPPRFGDPRTVPNPKWWQTWAISSPSALWLIMTRTLVRILAGAKSVSCQKA